MTSHQREQQERRELLVTNDQALLRPGGTALQHYAITRCPGCRTDLVRASVFTFSGTSAVYLPSNRGSGSFGLEIRQLSHRCCNRRSFMVSRLVIVVCRRHLASAEALTSAAVRFCRLSW